MEYRKLISFGNSSHVISLPKEWLVKNGLEKGDTLSLEVNGSNITVYPQEPSKEKEEIEITIEAKGLSLEVIKKKLISAYVNNADVIKIRGEDLKPKIRKIHEVVANLVAMEVIEQSTESIVLKSFLSTEDMDIDSLIRKADHVISSMFIDIENIIKTNAIEAAELSDNIDQRDEDVNRMCYLLFRIIDRRVKQGRLGHNKSSKNLLKMWLFNFFLEEIGDEIKRIARVLKLFENKEPLEEYLEMVGKLKEAYKKSMKAFYKDDKELVYEVAKDRENLLEECDDMQDRNVDHPLMTALMDRTKRLAANIHDINRVSY